MPRRNVRRRRSSARRALSRSARVVLEGMESRLMLSAGDLDTTFGSGGKVEAGFGGTMNSGARDAALQSDGKIVVLTQGENDANAKLVRFTANGQLDTTFGTGGIVSLPFRADAFAVRPDNKVVVAGEFGKEGNNGRDGDSVLLARYTANGQVDTTFGGGDGQAVQPVFGGTQTGNKTITKIVIRPDNGRVYVAGDVDAFDSGLTQFALSAYNADGTPFTFGDQYVNGTTTEFGYTNHLADVLLTPDGRIVAVGTMTVSDSHHPNVQQDFAVARYNEFGQLDPSFSGDGKLLVDFGDWPRSDPNSETDDAFDWAQSVARDAAGNLLIAGFSHDPTDDSPFLTAVTRVKPDGTLDTTFGPGGVEGDGRVTMSFTVVTFASLNDVAVLPTGKILVSTATQGFSDVDFGLARLNANGSEDSTFGINGRVFTDIDNDDLPRQLLLQSGKALLVGASTQLNTQPGPISSSLVMARYLLDDTPRPQSPFGGTPWPVPGVLEFEDFDDGGEGVAYHDTDSINQGEAYRSTGVDIQRVPANDRNDYTLAFAKAGEWTEYTINVAQAGTYDVAVEYSSLRGGGKFHLEVDDRVVTPVTTVQSTGDWQNYRTLTFSGINLTAGDHVFRLEMDANDSIGYVANFNRARFILRSQPPSNQSPFGLHPVSLPGVLSFEDYDRGGEGVAYHDTEPQNLGGAYRSEGADVQEYPNGATVLAFTKAGEWTEYTVDVTQGGVHGVSVNYSSLRGGGKFHLDVDGVRLTPTFTLPSTGSWEEYRWLHLGQFNMPAGRHVIRLSMDANDSTGYVGNFNHAAFRFIAPVAPTPFKGTPFAPNQTIEAEDYDGGGEGVAYHDSEPQNLGGAYRPLEGVDVQPTGDVGGGYNVGFARPGEYLTYTVGTPAGGTFGLQMRMAALRDGGTGTVEIDGNYVFSFDVPFTGDWQTYATVSTPKDLQLAPGVHTIRVRSEFADSTGYVGNYNWFRLVS